MNPVRHGSRSSTVYLQYVAAAARQYHVAAYKNLERAAHVYKLSTYIGGFTSKNDVQDRLL
jgi:hypothetical protein